MNTATIAIRYTADRNGRPLAHYWHSGFSRFVATTPGTIGRWIRLSAAQATAWIADGRGYLYEAA